MTMIKNDGFFEKPQDSKIDINIAGDGPNVLSHYLNERMGETAYLNEWMKFIHVEYWNAAPGDTGVRGETVSDYMTQMWNRLKFQNGSQFLEIGGPFNGYRVETWHLTRAQNTPDTVDGGIDKYAGLTWSNKFTRVNSKYCKGGSVYAHEFGHNYHFCCGMFDNTKSQIGLALSNEFHRLRGSDFTGRTAKYERFAEDFKYFFGTNDVANIDNPDDDAAHPTHPQVGRQTRWPRNVTGLKSFIQGAWPIYNWLKDKDIVNFNYLEADNWFKWERKTSWVSSQWEAFVNGVFYRWDGSKWVVYN